MPQLHLYLVSDSSGETVSAVGKAASTQFIGMDTVEYMWPLVRSIIQVDELLVDVRAKNGVIVHTMINNEIREYLVSQCDVYNIPCLCPIQPVMDLITRHTSMLPNKNAPGKYQVLDSAYFRKIDSINFTIAHDDGQNQESYDNADIIILGVSRTSKSPTSFYLAQRGFKVANLPIVIGMGYDSLKTLSGPLLIGFNMDAERLVHLRRARCLEKNFHNQSRYYSLEAVLEEIGCAKNLFRGLRVPIIDVTRKAIEEVAAEIINLRFAQTGMHKVS